MSNGPRKLLKGAALLAAGQVVGYTFSFARNLILARLLTKADFGLAAALSMTISLLELVSQMAFGQQTIQAREGDEPCFQAVAQAVQLAVGMISTILVLAAAHPMALALGVPGVTWAFASLVLVPLARGAMHLDLARLQRQFIYGPVVLSELVPQGLATAAAWPLTVWLDDFRAVLWIMLGKELLTVAMSHLLAERPFQLAWEKNHVKQMLAFGYPLLLTSLVLFGAQQADQMLIGAIFSLEDLALYSIAFTLTSVPWFIFSRVAGALLLPALAHHQGNPVRFTHDYHRSLELSAVGALVAIGPLLVAGDPLVRLLYGPKYSAVGTLMMVFGATVALRFFRWAPALAALSRADTMNSLISNIARAASLPLAIAVVALGTRNPSLVAGCGLAGEALAILVSALRVRKRLGIGLEVHVRPLLFLLGWIAVGVALQQWMGEGASVWLGWGAVVALWGAGAVATLFLFPDLVSICRHVYRGHRTPMQRVQQ